MKRIWARLKAHWVRHLLAAVQVAIGVSVVSAVLLDVVPTLRSVVGGSASSGLFYAMYGYRTPTGSSYTAIFTKEDLEYLLSKADSIVAATFFEQEFVSAVRVGDDLWAVRGLAQVSPGLAEVTDLQLVSGRFFLPSDTDAPEPAVAVISAELAESLFPGRDPIGQTINLRPESEAGRLSGFATFGTPAPVGSPGLDVTVVGVFEYPEGTPQFSGFLSEMQRAEILIPATGRLSPSLSGGPALDQRYMRIFFRAAEGRSLEAIEEVQALLASRLEQRREAGSPVGEDGSLLIVPTGRSDALLVRARMTEALILGAMGIVALVVSGFSIFTTFLAGVAERVRAIGLARSLGATRLRILREIVGEAATLAGAGGLIGVLAAYPVRRFALAPLMSAPVSASAVDFLIIAAGALLVAAGIGAVAALYPAWTVARMMPAEAFREA